MLTLQEMQLWVSLVARCNVREAITLTDDEKAVILKVCELHFFAGNNKGA